MRANGMILARFGSLLLAPLLATAVHAEQAQPDSAEDTAASSDRATSDEIIVTARRRAESAQTVPIALTALRGDQIAVPGTIGLAQVAQLAPSLQLTATNPRNTNINIRGLGATPAFASLGLEYGVGVYVDQVYYSRPAQTAFDLYDLEQVEVLRGPQGTLFGKNTIAGAINIVSSAPKFEPQMRAEISLGNYRTIQARATATAPLSDTVAVRLTISNTVRDRGFQTIAQTGRRVHDLDSFTARGQLLFQPNDSVSFRLIGDYSDLRQDCCTGVTTAIRTTRVDGTLLPANFNLRVARFGYTPLPINPSARLLETNRPFNVALETYGGTGIGEFDLGGAVITSVTGWRKLTFQPNTDGDIIGIDVFENAGVREQQEQFSQELRIASKGSNAIDYVAGLYYFWQRIDNRIFVNYGRDAALWILGPQPAGGTSPSIGGQAALNGLFADGTATARTRSYAAFTEATWHATDRLDLTGGLRFTHEKKDGAFGQVQRGPTLTATEILFGAQAIRNAFAPNIPTYVAETTEDDLSGRATIAYRPTSDIMAYATYSRGFKSGGLNLNATTAPRVIEPERIQAYEVGLKTQFFDRKLTVNLAAFNQNLSNYQSQQIDTRVAQTAFIANVGDVRSRGFEIDTSLRLGNDLRLFAAANLTDATYRSFTNAPCPVEFLGLATICDLSGRRLPGVSKYSLSAGGQYATAIAVNREAYINLDYAYRSSFYTTFNLAQDSLAPAYGVVNAQIGVRAASGRWDISLFARNLFDSTFISIINPSAFNTGQSSAILGDPRTFGLTLRTRL